MTSRRSAACVFGKLACRCACSARNSPALASTSVGDAIVFSRTAPARRSLAATASTGVRLTRGGASEGDGRPPARRDRARGPAQRFHAHDEREKEADAAGQREPLPHG